MSDCDYIVRPEPRIIMRQCDLEPVKLDRVPVWYCPACGEELDLLVEHIQNREPLCPNPEFWRSWSREKITHYKMICHACGWGFYGNKAKYQMMAGALELRE